MHKKKMMMIKPFVKIFPRIVFTAILMSCFSVYAQKNDFGAWYTLSARYDITKKLRADISEELRTYENASQTDQFFTDLGLSYKFNKYVSAGGYYRFSRKQENDDRFHSRNRFYGELDLSYPIYRFDLTYRIRFQRQVNNYAEDIEEKKPILVNRHKISIEYNIPNIKLSPTLSFERFYRLKYVSPYFPVGNRYEFKLDYKISKKHMVSLGYLVDEDLYPNTKYLYALTLGYRFSIN